MLKVIDKCKMPAEEIKQELMHQWDEYRVCFDKVYNATDLTDEQKYESCYHIAGCMSAIINFLTKIGVEVRDAESGMMAFDAAPYSNFAKMQDLKLRLMKKKPQ